MKECRFEKSDKSIIFTFPAKLEIVDQVCKQVELLLREKALDRLVFDVQLLVREILNNCIFHGCNMDAEKEVYMECVLEEKNIIIRAQDSGAGFNWREFIDRCVPDDTCINGRGLEIVCLYADSVEFNKQGNKVQIKKNIKPKTKNAE